jgi:hypothetical protein
MAVGDESVVGHPLMIPSMTSRVILACVEGGHTPEVEGSRREFVSRLGWLVGYRQNAMDLVGGRQMVRHFPR